jgi:hypothetical protein
LPMPDIGGERQAVLLTGHNRARSS